MEHFVSIGSSGFSPHQILSEIGAKITWTNGDGKPHTVKALDGSFDSGPINPGKSWSHTFTAAGKHAYADPTAPSFTGEVLVS